MNFGGKTLLTLFFIVGFVSIGIFYNIGESGNEENLSAESKEAADVVAKENSNPSMDAKQIVVYIEGAIAKPGLVYAPIDARLGEIINLSGGLLAMADSETLNMARPVKDGEQITVPFKKNITSEKYESNLQKSNEPININTASAEELQKLPRIGPSTAKKIIEYRERHGDFKTVDELKNVPRIGEKTFDKLKDMITV